MSAFENAKKFFHACEAPLGWESCKPYVAEGASFSSQCEPLTEIDTVKAYSEWVAGFVARKSSIGSTSPRPIIACHRRFTIIRAKYGFSSATSHWASAAR